MKRKLASLIDCAVLDPESRLEDISDACKAAIKYGFAAVAVMPYHIKYIAELLAGTDVKACAAVGFPLGVTTPEVKGLEALTAVKHGASEIDMVINLGALKNKKYGDVLDDIAGVVDAVSGKALVKVILETCLLTDDEKIKACDLARVGGAGFVKTSTGFGSDGATVYDVRLMKTAVGDTLGVKASGKVRTYEDAFMLVEAGATRLGCGAKGAVSIAKQEISLG